VLLLYGLATAAISINAIVTVIYFDTILINKMVSYGNNPINQMGANVTDKTTLDIRDNYTSHDVPGPAGEFLLDAETHSVDAYYVLMWVATAVLLLYNVKRIGKIKYWSLFGLALAYFFSYYASPVDLFQPTSSNESNDVIIFYLLFATYSITIGGVLFGIGFWLISRTIKIENKIRNYMNIVAISIILFFTAGEATVSQTSFPPFGLANVSFVGLSCYLLLTGLTFSALSILKDIELRKYIKKYANESSKLFGSMGMAEMENELKTKVMSFAKGKDKLLIESDNVDSSLSEDEIKNYVDEVVDQIAKGKPKGK
jgi:hypothetical protein